MFHFYIKRSKLNIFEVRHLKATDASHEWDTDRRSKTSWNGFPRFKDGAEKAQPGAPRTSTSLILGTSTVSYPPAEICARALHLPQTSYSYHGFCSSDTVNTTRMTTSTLRFHSTPPEVTFCWLEDVDQGKLIFNNARLQIITVQQQSEGILYILIFRGGKKQKNHIWISRLVVHSPLSFFKDKMRLFSKQRWKKHTWKS